MYRVQTLWSALMAWLVPSPPQLPPAALAALEPPPQPEPASRAKRHQPAPSKHQPVRELPEQCAEETMSRPEAQVVSLRSASLRPALAPALAPKPAQEVQAAERWVEAAETVRAWSSGAEPVTVGWGFALTASFAGPIGTEGLPWASGELYLEQHPDLSPVKARGRWGDPGVWHELQSLSPASSRLLEITAALTSTPWRLSPPSPPADPTDKGLYDQQLQFQQELWRRWTQRGLRRGLRAWIEELVRTPLVYGFGLWEVYDGPDGWPALPAWRAPWGVERWLIQGETPVGWIQQISTQDGAGRAAQRVLVPWTRTIHVAHRPLGPSDLEGRSLMRDAYTPLRALRALIRDQGRSAATNAQGVWTSHTELGATNVNEADLDALADHILSYESAHVPYVLPPAGVKMELVSAQHAVADLSPQIQTAERLASHAMGGAHQLIALQGEGSYAARSSASGDARDVLDYYAQLVISGIEQALAHPLRARWPGRVWVCAVEYGQVEQRDNAAYIGTLATYARDVRPLLWPEARALLDEMLDLPKGAPSTQDAQDLQAREIELILAEPDSSLPVPKGVQDNAQRALRWMAKGLAGKDFTAVGRARAVQLARGGPVSTETVRAMRGWFRRHVVDRAAEGFEAGQEGFPNPARVAWDAWGGDEAQTWVEDLVKKWDQDQEAEQN